MFVKNHFGETAKIGNSAAGEEMLARVFVSSAARGWLNDVGMQHMQKYQLQCNELELAARPPRTA